MDPVTGASRPFGNFMAALANAKHKMTHGVWYWAVVLVGVSVTVLMNFILANVDSVIEYHGLSSDDLRRMSMAPSITFGCTAVLTTAPAAIQKAVGGDARRATSAACLMCLALLTGIAALTVFGGLRAQYGMFALVAAYRSIGFGMITSANKNLFPQHKPAYALTMGIFPRRAGCAASVAVQY